MSGIGLHTGVTVHLRLCPAPAHSGIVFKRTDLDGFIIEAQLRHVARVSYATSLMKKGVLISTTEHLLSALAGLRVDNAIVEIDNLELPIVDGSALPFVKLIRQAGGLSSFHLCGRGKEYLDMGVFAQIQVDIVEGLGMPPTGNIPTLSYARSKIPSNTVLRGNIRLDLLRNASPNEVYGLAQSILAELVGERHILSGECDILFGTPAENIAALARACADR